MITFRLSAAPALVLALALVPMATAPVEVLIDHDGPLPPPDVHLGQAVAGAGDVNGDGVSDVIASGNQNSGSAAATVVILSGVDGAVLHEFSYPSILASAVAGIGDVDGDGHDDVVIGQKWSDRFAVRSGQSGAVLHDETLPIGCFGASVAGAGDVDLDGVPDLLVGAGSDSDQLIVGDTVQLRSGADFSVIHELSYDPPTGSGTFGWSVAGLGDVDGDGHPDFVVGAPVHTGLLLNMSGRVFVHSGHDASLLHDVQGSSANEYLGRDVANAGDLDGDGINDVLATGKASIAGQEFVRAFSGATGATLLSLPVVSGQSSGVDIEVDGLGDLDQDGRPDFALGREDLVELRSGVDGHVLMAWDTPIPAAWPSWSKFSSVAHAGDVDGDGRGDVVVGLRGGGSGGGRVMVLAGKPLPWVELGQGLGGASGVPVLAATGSLERGSPGSLAVSGVPAGAPVVLFVGLDAADLPFKGGVLVPSPDIALTLGANAAGELLIAWSAWPGLPPYTSFFVQAWAADTSAPKGASASHALVGTAP